MHVIALGCTSYTLYRNMRHSASDDILKFCHFFLNLFSLSRILPIVARIAHFIIVTPTHLLKSFFPSTFFISSLYGGARKTRDFLVKR